MEELKDLPKDELIKKCIAYIGNCRRQQIQTQNKNCQIRHFRNRLKRIRDSIDYLLKHPFSEDVGNRTNKHKRDIPRNQKSKQK